MTRQFLCLSRQQFSHASIPQSCVCSNFSQIIGFSLWLWKNRLWCKVHIFFSEHMNYITNCSQICNLLRVVVCICQNKVQLFWEGHKNLEQLVLTLLTLRCQINKWAQFAVAPKSSNIKTFRTVVPHICGLLRIMIPCWEGQGPSNSIVSKMILIMIIALHNFTCNRTRNLCAKASASNQMTNFLSRFCTSKIQTNFVLFF